MSTCLPKPKRKDLLLIIRGRIFKSNEANLKRDENVFK